MIQKTFYHLPSIYRQNITLLKTKMLLIYLTICMQLITCRRECSLVGGKIAENFLTMQAMHANVVWVESIIYNETVQECIRTRTENKHPRAHVFWDNYKRRGHREHVWHIYNQIHKTCRTEKQRRSTLIL